MIMRKKIHKTPLNKQRNTPSSYLKDKVWVWMKNLGEKRIYDGELNVAILKKCLGVTY